MIVLTSVRLSRLGTLLVGSGGKSCAVEGFLKLRKCLDQGDTYFAQGIANFGKVSPGLIGSIAWSLVLYHVRFASREDDDSGGREQTRR